MIANRLTARRAHKFFRFVAPFSEVARSQGRAPAQRDSLQFSKRRLVDFGELPHGEIPNALQFSRPTTMDKLQNGVSVVTEQWVGNQAAITVAVKVGSRQETVANSSVAQFVSRVALKGTSSKSKTDFELAIAKLGGQIETNVTREMTYFSIFVDKNSVADAVALLGDAISNPVFDTVQVEAEKAAVHKNASSMDPEQVVINNLHYTSFRDHAIGQSNAGMRDNVYSITADQVKEFHSKYYCGNNIVVSAAGEVNPAEFQAAVSKHFGGIRQQVNGAVDNAEQPFFTPSLMFQRDDELPNISAGASFIAPGWNHPDFFAMNYFKRIIGDFRVDKYTGAHLNTAKLQYNTFHEDLGDYPDIVIHKPLYFAYSDVGLFGNFLFGNEIWSKQLVMISQNKMSSYAQNINQAEVFRARNKYWNDLLARDDPVKVAQINSNQAAYLGRLINRTEIATRVSCMDPQYISNVASKWFWDNDTSITAWGPIHGLMADSIYTRMYRRATLGEYSMLRVKYDY